jgi:GTP-binding protein
MATNHLQTAEYLKAAHLPHQLPDDTGQEVAFAGRSNAGKSSALNAICQRNGLARTSKTPGRTQQLVYFQVRPEHYLVDLPGYGFAKVSRSMKETWQDLASAYLRGRPTLMRIFVLIDGRHGVKESDREIGRAHV